MLPIAFLILVLVLCLAPPNQGCTQTERDSLVSFRNGLSTASQARLASWGAAGGQNCCMWEGIACNIAGSVVNLSLPSKGLRGPISPALGNLSQLTRIDLSRNSLLGTIDAALLSLRNIQTLDLSFNSLSGSLLLQKPTPSLHLQVLNVSSNRFTGEFPQVWDAATELRAMNGSNNAFSGSMPSDICSGSAQLKLLDLSMNQLTGKLPAGLGSCSQLQVLRLGFNNFTGEIPDDLYDAVELQELSLSSNHLSGMLDGVGIAKLENLVLFDLGANEIEGMLPDSLGKLTKLEHLLLNSNRLNGVLPSALHNCSRLKCLNLRENNLSGELSAVNFESFLQLETLDLGNNNFTGRVPESIYSCTSLNALRLAKNSLEGQIAPDLVNLTMLTYLSLSSNNLRNITAAFEILGRCKNLTSILLSTNFKGESMPQVIHDEVRFANVRVLALANCQLTGQVPSWLSGLKNLELLDLSLNQLTGPLPRQLGNLPKLFYLDLSRNNFDKGGIPLELLKLQVLTSRQAAAEVNRTSLLLPVFDSRANTSLPLQYNQLSSLKATINLKNSNLEGVIPPEVGQLEMLQVLDLSQNILSGEIPVQISQLANLQVLTLSNNNLSGNIPPELIRLSFLASFNVSFNNLSGPIPTGGQFYSFPSSSFAGNPGLCGLPLIRSCKNASSTIPINSQYKSINKKLIVGVVLGICFGVASVVSILVVYMLHRRRGGLQKSAACEKDVGMNINISIPCDDGNNLVVLFPGNSDMKSLTVPDILKATNNFSQDSIIGCGGFGLVFKAVLPDGSKLAIKRLSGETGIMEREFKAEVEALSSARHENLVTLQGYCIHGPFRLLIYSYVENGSLDYWLHEKIDGAASLTWAIRLQIAKGASRGLAYIHQICEPHIVHRDIKSSNILLNHKFQAHVADFGLSRLILPTNTHVSTEMVGTLGYIPPEYGQAWIATLRGDIYSFGVVMLELLTGRRPFEVFKPKQSRDLVGWVQHARSQGKVEEIFDPLLRENGFKEQMVQALDIACLCVNSNPFKRPTIGEIVYWLDNVGVDQQTPKQL